MCKTYDDIFFKASKIILLDNQGNEMEINSKNKNPIIIKIVDNKYLIDEPEIIYTFKKGN